MYTLKLICLTIIQLVKQAWSLPQSFAIAARQKRRQTVLNELKTEPLDRIRNPSKYPGEVMSVMEPPGHCSDTFQ